MGAFWLVDEVLDSGIGKAVAGAVSRAGFRRGQRQLLFPTGDKYYSQICIIGTYTRMRRMAPLRWSSRFGRVSGQTGTEPEGCWAASSGGKLFLSNPLRIVRRSDALDASEGPTEEMLLGGNALHWQSGCRTQSGSRISSACHFMMLTRFCAEVSLIAGKM